MSESGGVKIGWNPETRRFETEDKKAYLEYELSEDGKVMNLFHTYVPPSKRGSGVASLLCAAAFTHADSLSLRVLPSCSYISKTFLPKNPSWNFLVQQDGAGAKM